MTNIKTLTERWREAGPVSWAEHRLGWIMPDGQPITLAPWQRAVLETWWKHRDNTSTLAISCIKKVGKTTTNAILTAWRWLSMPGEHYCCANDLDQSAGLQFKMISAMAEHHPLLAGYVKVSRTRLVFEPTGSELTALAVDAAGSAGANHLSSSHTETWGIQHEGARRAWEELTPQPGRFYGLPALRIADSYAGFSGESDTWHDLVDRGLAGERLPGDWPMYQSGGLLLFHMSGLEAQERCFRGTPARRTVYYLDQAAALRPGAFRRLHKNERASADDSFITVEQWQGCVVNNYRIPVPSRETGLFVGVDLATKRDYAAVVTVFTREGSYYVGPYRVWKPSPVIDLDAVEEYLLDLARDYHVIRAAADPFQAMHLIQRCEKAGLSIEEFPQTLSNLTVMGNHMWDVIRQGRLVVPGIGADELRDHVLAASGKETPRGVRLVKGTGKIDAAISLAIAIVTAGPAWHVGAAGAIAHIDRGIYVVTDAQREKAIIGSYTGRMVRRGHLPGHERMFRRNVR